MDRKTTLIEPPSKPAEIGNQTSLEQLTIRGLSLTNLSGLPREQVFNWLPHRSLEISKAAFFPDATPIKNGIPTGCAIETFDPKWRKYAAFDAGCGMRVLQSELSWQDFSNDSWDKLAGVLMDRQYNRGLRTRATGILGTGNHFVDAFVSHSDMKVWFIIHSGSTTEGSSLKRLTRMPDEFDREYDRVISWAKSNREAIGNDIEKLFGKPVQALDVAHNLIEKKRNGAVILRKGCVQANPGGVTILPSHMAGDAALLRVEAGVAECMNSLCHGTGRSMSRTDARRIVGEEDCVNAREKVYIPPAIKDSRILVHTPKNYRNLDDALNLIGDRVTVLERFSPIAFIGGL